MTMLPTSTSIPVGSINTATRSSKRNAASGNQEGEKRTRAERRGSGRGNAQGGVRGGGHGDGAGDAGGGSGRGNAQDDDHGGGGHGDGAGDAGGGSGRGNAQGNDRGGVHEDGAGDADGGGADDGDDDYPTDCVCGRQNYEPLGQWVLCERCKKWLHSECEALTESTLESSSDDYICSRCEKQDATLTPRPKRGKGSRGSSKSERPCTPFCAGCRNGQGCETGMGELTCSFRERIWQFTLDTVAAVEKQMRHRRKGEMVLVKQPPPSKRKKRALVIIWGAEQVAIIYEEDLHKPKEKQTRHLAAKATVFRVPPGMPSAAALEVKAIELGCIRAPPYRKQLAFEMRKARVGLLSRGFIEKDGRTNHLDLYKIVR